MKMPDDRLCIYTIYSPAFCELAHSVIYLGIQIIVCKLNKFKSIGNANRQTLSRRTTVKILVRYVKQNLLLGLQDFLFKKLNVDENLMSCVIAW